MKLRNISIILLMAWGLFSSCVPEDRDNCHNYYVVDLSYVGNNGIKNILKEKISKLHMYIFDSECKCVSSTDLTYAEITACQANLPALGEGDYKIVLLGNAHKTYVSSLDSADFSKIVFTAEDYVDGKKVSGNDSLYFASAGLKIEPYDKKRPVTYQTISLNSAHYDVSVEVTGVPPVPQGGSYPKIRIEGLSPYTDFTQTVLGKPTTYELKTRYDGIDKLTASCNIMRHLNHEDVFLKIYSPAGEELAAVNFAAFITQNRNYIDCSQQEVLIPFKIEFKSNAGVSVTLPDWIVHEDVKPEY